MINWNKQDNNLYGFPMWNGGASRRHPYWGANHSSSLPISNLESVVQNNGAGQTMMQLSPTELGQAGKVEAGLWFESSDKQVLIKLKGHFYRAIMRSALLSLSLSGSKTRTVRNRRDDGCR